MKKFLLQKSNKNMQFVIIDKHSIPVQIIYRLEMKDSSEKSFIRIYFSGGSTYVDTGTSSLADNVKLLKDTTLEINKIINSKKEKTA